MKTLKKVLKYEKYGHILVRFDDGAVQHYYHISKDEWDRIPDSCEVEILSASPWIVLDKAKEYQLHAKKRKMWAQAQGRVR